MMRTKIGSILRFIMREIYEYTENFEEEMFVLDWWLTFFIFHLTGDNIPSSAAPALKREVITAKKQFWFDVILMGLGFFPPSLNYLCHLPSWNSPSLQGKSLGTFWVWRQISTGTNLGKWVGGTCSRWHTGLSFLFSYKSAGAPPDHLWSINYSNTSTHCL